MLTIEVPTIEGFDERTQTFVEIPGCSLELEHSLVSLSKWESKFCKAFLGREQKTVEEALFYVECMTLSQNFPAGIFDRLSAKNFEQINEYINRKMTATKFFDDGKKNINRETVTSELIYYWMFALQIPIEAETWHLNRLLTLIQVSNLKNSPPKKNQRGTSTAAERKALNEARRKQYNTSG
jgi:hypothetical protein